MRTTVARPWSPVIMRGITTWSMHAVAVTVVQGKDETPVWASVRDAYADESREKGGTVTQQPEVFPDRPQGTMLDHLAVRDIDTVCHWFAACTNRAVKHRHHPILREVPICASCDELADKLAP